MDRRWIVQLGGAGDLGNGKGLQAALPPQVDCQPLALLTVQPEQHPAKEWLASVETIDLLAQHQGRGWQSFSLAAGVEGIVLALASLPSSPVVPAEGDRDGAKQGLVDDDRQDDD
jgi:hypothetical protein